MIDKEFKEKILAEIDDGFSNREVDTKLVLNLISLANDYALLNQPLLEVFFIKLFNAAMKWENNTVPYFLEDFQINQERAGVLIERYITYELYGQVQMVSSTFNIIDKALKSAINNNIFFNEVFLLNSFIEINMAGYEHKQLLEKNKTNKANYLHSSLEKELTSKNQEEKIHKV